MPSRRDQTIFPGIWAWLDQEFENLIYDNNALNLSVPLRNIHMRLVDSLHWLWPEVILATFSWAFYKLLDSVLDNTTSTVMGGPGLQVGLQQFMMSTIAHTPQTMKDRYKLTRQ
jgi:hypothetical protein